MQADFESNKIPGDLVVKLTQEPEHRFRRHDSELQISLELTLLEVSMSALLSHQVARLSPRSD